MTNKKAVLVYSGGLDTSICIPFARETYGYQDLITVTVDVGQPASEIEEAAQKAAALGTTHHTVDAKDEFAREYCWPALRANALYQGYPLSTSIARPLIAKKAVEVARKLGSNIFIHGCTGKGNDQFRIEFGIRSLMPDAIIHAPIREENMTRSWEIEYGLSRGVPLSQSLKKIWSIDENLWGRSIEGGQLEDPTYCPPEEIFKWTVAPEKTPLETKELLIEFAEGAPTALDGIKLTPADLIAKLNIVAGSYGVGRIDIMEDRMLGLKVRENYECPAAIALLTAHRALESLVLTHGELSFKAKADHEWSELAYRGLWHDPLKAALDVFINHTQKRVSGWVKLRFARGNLQVIGRQSSWALYDANLASFDTTDFDQRDSTGTVKHYGLQARLYNQLAQRNKDLGQ